MPQAPHQFNTIICKRCGAPLALLPPGALLHTTRLRCVCCGEARTLRPEGSKDREPLVLAVAPT